MLGLSAKGPGFIKSLFFSPGFNKEFIIPAGINFLPFEGKAHV